MNGYFLSLSLWQGFYFSRISNQQIKKEEAEEINQYNFDGYNYFEQNKDFRTYSNYSKSILIIEHWQQRKKESFIDVDYQ